MRERRKPKQKKISVFSDIVTPPELLEFFEYAKLRPDALEESFRSWWEGLHKTPKGAIYFRLTTLRQQPASRFQDFFEGPIKEGGIKYQGIYKMKFGGRIEFRPMACRGPLKTDKRGCVTFLCGAQEVQSCLSPSPTFAIGRRSEIVADPKLRRPLQLPNPNPDRWAN